LSSQKGNKYAWTHHRACCVLQVKIAINLQAHITVHAVSCHYCFLILDRFCLWPERKATYVTVRRAGFKVVDAM
jgi:hypothetical protein